MESTDIKTLVPASCPHCKKEFVLDFLISLPDVRGLYTPDELSLAKRDAISRIEGLNISDSKKRETISWISQLDVIFSPNDIEELLKNLEQNDIPSSDTIK